MSDSSTGGPRPREGIKTVHLVLAVAAFALQFTVTVGTVVAQWHEQSVARALFENQYANDKKTVDEKLRTLDEGVRGLTARAESQRSGLDQANGSLANISIDLGNVKEQMRQGEERRLQQLGSPQPLHR